VPDQLQLPSLFSVTLPWLALSVTYRRSPTSVAVRGCRILGRADRGVVRRHNGRHIVKITSKDTLAVELSALVAVMITV